MCVINQGKQILLAVQEHIDKDAVIAGGWVRDQYVGNTPKDVDVWITKDFNPNILFSILPGGGGMRRFRTNRLIDARLIHVTKFVYQGVDIDIICFNPEAVPEQISHNPVDTFDFGICQCWFDGEYNEGYQGTDAFWEDYHNKTLTYLSNSVNDNRLEQIVTKRLPRMLEKFPGYEVKGLVLDEEEGTYSIDREFTNSQETVSEVPCPPSGVVTATSAGPSMVEVAEDEGETTPPAPPVLQDSEVMLTDLELRELTGAEVSHLQRRAQLNNYTVNYFSQLRRGARPRDAGNGLGRSAARLRTEAATSSTSDVSNQDVVDALLRVGGFNT